MIFWLHAIYEQGPPISNPAHWLLDSTLGFLALTPVLVVLLPLADARVRGHHRESPHQTARQAGVIGVVFALVSAGTDTS